MLLESDSYPVLLVAPCCSVFEFKLAEAEVTEGVVDSALGSLRSVRRKSRRSLSPHQIHFLPLCWVLLLLLLGWPLVLLRGCRWVLMFVAEVQCSCLVCSLSRVVHCWSQRIECCCLVCSVGRLDCCLRSPLKSRIDLLTWGMSWTFPSKVGGFWVSVVEGLGVHLFLFELVLWMLECGSFLC